MFNDIFQYKLLFCYFSLLLSSPPPVSYILTGTFLGILLFLSLSSPSPVFQSIAMFYTGDLRFISYDIGGILNLIPKQAAGESSQLPG